MNRDSYNRVAPDWDRARSGFYGREQVYLDAVLEGLPPRSRLVDLGCGTGRPMAEYAIARGHRITGVDQAHALLAIARSRFPGERWIEGRLEDFVPDERYAGAICWDALFHIDRSAHRAILDTVARALEPGGRIMLTVGGSEHPPFTDTMFGETFRYDSHPPERALDLVREAGFEPVIAEFMNLPTTGRDKGRYAIVARLAASA